MTKLSLLLAVCVAASACKKKDDAKPQDPKPATSPASGGDDYAAKATALMTGMAAIFEAGGQDCDKLATDVSKYLDANKATIDAADAFEKTNPDAVKALEARMAPIQESLGKKMMPALSTCKDHEGLNAALAKLE